MRWRPTALALLLSVAAVTSAARARAGGCDSPQLSGCTDADTLWPHGGPQRFVGVGGTETLASGRVGFGLVGSYQSRPVMIQSAGNGARTAAIDNQINASFLFSYGLSSRLQFDAVLPITLWQDGAGLQALTGGKPLPTSASRDLRFGVALAIVPRARVTEAWAPRGGAFEPGRAWSLTARFEVAAPTGDRGQLAGDRTAVFVPTIAADYRPQDPFFGRFSVGLELGARLRGTTSLLGSRVGTQMVVGLGVGFDILTRDRLTVGAEARVLPTFASQADAQLSAGAITTIPSNRVDAPSEWLVSLRSAPIAGGDFAIQLAGGGPIPFTQAIGTPRARITLSVVFAPTNRDSDGDGVPDRDDKCPAIAGVLRGDEGPGCPHVELPPLPPPLPPPAPLMQPADPSYEPTRTWKGADP